MGVGPYCKVLLKEKIIKIFITGVKIYIFIYLKDDLIRKVKKIAHSKTKIIYSPWCCSMIPVFPSFYYGPQKDIKYFLCFKNTIYVT